jgi:hypothetical protein
MEYVQVLIRMYAAVIIIVIVFTFRITGIPARQ